MVSIIIRVVVWFSKSCTDRVVSIHARILPVKVSDDENIVVSHTSPNKGNKNKRSF